MIGGEWGGWGCRVDPPSLSPTPFFDPSPMGDFANDLGDGVHILRGVGGVKPEGKEGKRENEREKKTREVGLTQGRAVSVNVIKPCS